MISSLRTVSFGLACLFASGTLAQAPAPKPPAKPAPKSAPQGEAPAASKHALIGDWNVYWVADNRTSKMKVLQAQTVQGVTSFAGAFATGHGEACTFSGSVLDTFSAQFVEEQNTRNVSISAYVLMKALCDNGQIWVEAFGLPSGKALMSGRATFVGLDGRRSYAAVAFGR